MPRHPASHSPRSPVAPLMLLVVLAFPNPMSVSAVAQSDGEEPLSPAQLDARNRAIKRGFVQQLSEDAWHRHAGMTREAAEQRAESPGGRPGPRGARGSGAPEAAGDGAARPPVSGGAIGFPWSGTSAIPANVRANDPTGDAADAGQAEEGIAAWGPYVLVAWNDGQGQVTGGDKIGYSYSTDSGVTYVDGGDLPKLAGWRWTTDPVVTVNEKTGAFYVCAVVDSTTSANGIAVVRATFFGSAISWDTPRLVVSFNTATDLADKPWVAADSSSGNVYLTYTHFVGMADSIIFRRSTDQGASWGPMITLSSPTGAGRVQGARPALGPNGEVYAIWSEIGLVDADYFRIRKSVDQGASFGIENMAAAFYANTGTGAPGFNRARGITYPSIAVDRTAGPYRGRVYVAWNESVNWYNDPLGVAGSKSEVENNGAFASATAFTPGQKLRGTFGSTDDLDYFSFPATQGSTYIFRCDSIPDPLYSMRIFCGQDTFTQLAFSGELRTPAGGSAFIVWTAPASGTYYFRMGYVAGASLGGYRVRSGLNTLGPEIGRDQRDVIVRFSNDGASWATPVRVNDDLPRYDNWLPEVTVGADGCPYVAWFDWRDDGCGGRSYQYVSRSDNGGASWVASQRFSDVHNSWTSILSNLVPNQGDYSGLCAEARYVRPAWADGRDGSADVYTASIDTWFELSACPDDTTVNELDAVNVGWTGLNLNPLFANTYEFFVTDTRGWPMPGLQSVTAPAGSSFGVPLAVEVPDSAAGGVNTLCLTLRNLQRTRGLQCCFEVTVVDVVAVGEPRFDFGLRPSAPNPASGWVRIAFNLPHAGRARLRIYGLRGEHVRTLMDGPRPAGLHSATWDGRDEQGHPVAAGAYFLRLEGDGRLATRRLVWLR